MIFRAAILLAGAALGAEPLVTGFERFHAAKPTAEGGRLLYNELGCVNCHGGATGLPALRGPALATVNRQLFPDIREDMFISMAYCILDESNGKAVIARAGHDPALLYREETGKVELLRSPGLALGVDEGDVFERVTKDQEIELHQGDCLLFYTDGVREAVNSDDEEFGMERMSECFRNTAPLGAEAVLTRMQEELHQFTGEGPQMDDITLVAIEKKK